MKKTKCFPTLSFFFLLLKSEEKGMDWKWLEWFSLLRSMIETGRNVSSVFSFVVSAQ